MLFPSIVLLFLFQFFNLNQGNLIDYPLETTKGSVSILSTLTDQATQDRWTVKENLVVTDNVRGKIEVTHGVERIEIFYRSKNDLTRLVIADNDCADIKYDGSINGWTSMVKTATNPLINIALLLGPSFYYRLVSKTADFVVGDNVQLNGETMASLEINFGLNLKASFLFPVYLHSYIGITQPKRLILTDSGHNGKVETVFYDIHYEKRLPSTFDGTLVTPTIGIGCPRYLEPNQLFPTFSAERYQVNVIETSSSGFKSTHRKFSVDSRNKLIQLSSTSNQLGTKKFEQLIIIHNLGIKYRLDSTSGKCYIEPLEVSDNGLLTDDYLLKENPITLDIKNFKYVGKVSYNHRSESVDAWESTEYNVTIGGIIYDKIVTTQFLTKWSNSNNDSGYIPIAGEQNFYQLFSDSYSLRESRKRDFFNYRPVNYDQDDHKSFQITDCYDSTDDKMTLTLQVSTLDTNHNNGEENVNSLREKIKQIIVTNLDLSYFRLVRVDIEFESIYIVARIEIVKSPDILDALENFDSKFVSQSFDGYEKISSSNSVDCLKLHGSDPNIRYVIDCIELDNLCIGVTKGKELPQTNSSGSYCTIYVNHGNKLSSLIGEITLEQLTQQFNRLAGIEFNLDCYHCFLRYKIVKVFQYSASIGASESQLTFMNLVNGAKLSSFYSELVSGVKNFGDCYRACISTKGSKCETFSFCSSPSSHKSIECHISEDTYRSLTINGTKTNSSCNIYGKNNLLDYHKIPSVKFIKNEITSSSDLTVQTADDCARACVDSKEDCYSFQICDSRYCSFSGHFTSSNTISNAFCNIYIPKQIQNFIKNSHQIIVSPIIKTEVDLNLDQCASLCVAISSQSNDPKMDCKSFNFCPKGEATSICQISSETLSSSVSDKISSSSLLNDCSNYQYIETFTRSTVTQRHQYKHKIQWSSFSIIAFFVSFGLIIGLAVPWLLKRAEKQQQQPQDTDETNPTQNNDDTVSTSTGA